MKFHSNARNLPPNFTKFHAHLRGYVSRSMMTRLILATQPWSHVAITLVVI